jgi:phosphate transport system permease protein
MTAIAAVPTTLAGSRASLGRRVRNHLATVLITLALLVALVPLVWLLWTVISRGWHAVTQSGWFSSSQRNITYQTPGGGAYHAIIGTLEQVALCAVISVPIALLVGIYLVEYGRGPMARVTTFMVDILTGLPSIVAALFIYSVFIIAFGGQKAGWLVSLALVMLMIPVIVRTTEEMLRLVPNELREAAYALGVPKWKAIIRVVVPTAFTGILTGIVLGISRVAGETAPLLILATYTTDTNTDLFSGPQGTLPSFINDQTLNYSNKGTYILGANGQNVLVHNYAVDRVWGAALTLIVIVMLLNLIARTIGHFNRVST